MGKQKDQEGSRKRIIRDVFDTSLTDVGRLALDKDRLALDRERARSQAIRELLLAYSSMLVTTAFHPR